MHCCNKSEPSSGHQPPKSRSANRLGAKWPYLCAAGLGAGFVALTVFKIPPANILTYGVILACPLLHLVMMKDHGKAKDNEKSSGH
ncbi:hypothetical protein A3J20_04315 [Candidatus Gottesmanbacteria bacterium RIFCSPLOWO2_02_FULL_42_29]|uniref:DUF2933 domain-containing protein n=2 Tax=Candidatus Gottesmaniibacteriota TaxID=1752720 RepID=A0A1F6BAI0_9BACT|nr:MAG: hypothetical protein UV09_C0010G0002 [Candidatus Gottesmanbacteria bacterium GW2011_GWA2_42_18]KKS76197.1 MAG: hypothetical protein UV46_C0007G0023 [Candidatus Gottesmanbacteria bacterium GW2011_GWC2_42_8]OGG11097.1 MAG: hypothetical protein A2781_00045 [Candidatus Gottesmanbacteria bacterium RIFCSPHIGHO2_01_FULL_42_27]OGG21953.1 MAG: hypothetical protein A3E72_03475 [Candidatus Gottesmanbacteria bacterium RIFCSPHIGHO2_12_FULL_43_26]OGG33939.1 MAG: hypothetical protein A3G68_00235 [Cand